MVGDDTAELSSFVRSVNESSCPDPLLEHLLVLEVGMRQRRVEVIEERLLPKQLVPSTVVMRGRASLREGRKVERIL